jgi:hypothetical protein
MKNSASSPRLLDASLHALLRGVFALLASPAWLRFCATHESLAMRAQHFLTLLCGESGPNCCYVLHTCSGLDRTFYVEGHPLVHVGESSPRPPAGFAHLVAWRLVLLDSERGTVFARSDAPDDWARALEELPDESLRPQWAFSPVDVFEPAKSERIQHEQSLLRIEKTPRADYFEDCADDDESTTQWQTLDFTALQSFVASQSAPPVFVERDTYDVRVLPTALGESGPPSAACVIVGEIGRSMRRPCEQVKDAMRVLRIGFEEPDVLPALAPPSYALDNFLAALRPSQPNDPGHLRKIDWIGLYNLNDKAPTDPAAAREAAAIVELLCAERTVAGRLELLEKVRPLPFVSAPAKPTNPAKS